MNGRYLLLLGLLVSSRIVADHDPYGLLFTSPEQRARLDGRFAQTDSEESAQANAAGTDHQTTKAVPLRLNGTVISSVGGKQVWINGRRQMATRDAHATQVRLLGSNKVEVRQAASGVTHTLKPGQILDPSSGQIREAYERAHKP